MQLLRRRSGWSRPAAIRLTTVSSESVRLSQPVFARGWLTMRRSTPNRRNSRPTRRASASASWLHVGVECGIQLINRLVRVVGAREFSAGVLGSRGVKKRPRRRVKHVRGSHQCLGITFEYPAGIPGHPGEQRDRRLAHARAGRWPAGHARASRHRRPADATRAPKITRSKTWGQIGDSNSVMSPPASASRHGRRRAATPPAPAHAPLPDVPQMSQWSRRRARH